MWKEILLNYGIFLLEVLTILLAIFFIITMIFKMTNKQKEDKKELKLTNLRKKYQDLTDKISDFRLNENQLKEKQKQYKKQKKLEKKEKTNEEKIGVYVLNFKGDMAASQVNNLREEINGILSVADPKKDEVLLRLESSGGFVHSYGLAASQLKRIRNHGLKLRIVIDKVAASGGYMMACVADEIIAAPFAIIGSVGVVAQVPNIHKLLKKNDIDVDVMTAGEYKRTVTLLGEKTEKGVQKLQEELESTHELFKDFISENRSVVDIDKISTGEHWFGTKALELKLVDSIATSDDLILDYLKNENIDLIDVQFTPKKTLLQKLGKSAETSINDVTNKFII